MINSPKNIPRGWVYIIVNKSMPNLIKIGYSNKDPLFRAIALGNTGAPHKFQVVYDALVCEPYKVEQNIHLALETLSEGKEWFKCTIRVGLEVIREHSTKIYSERLDRELLNDINPNRNKETWGDIQKPFPDEVKKEIEVTKIWQELTKSEQTLMVIDIMRKVTPETWGDMAIEEYPTNMEFGLLDTATSNELWIEILKEINAKLVRNLLK